MVVRVGVVLYGVLSLVVLCFGGGVLRECGADVLLVLLDGQGAGDFLSACSVPFVARDVREESVLRVGVVALVVVGFDVERDEGVRGVTGVTETRGLFGVVDGFARRVGVGLVFSGGMSVCVGVIDVSVERVEGPMSLERGLSFVCVCPISFGV